MGRYTALVPCRDLLGAGKSTLFLIQKLSQKLSVIRAKILEDGSLPLLLFCEQIVVSGAAEDALFVFGTNDQPG